MVQYGYKQLIIWQKADEFAFQVYLATKTFPREELYGITSQLRRAALSVPTNIAEGYGRQGKGYLSQFINIALGSLAEAGYLLDFCLRLKIVGEEKHSFLQNLHQEIGRMLWKFYKNI
jgi:four helix bundle protein